MKAEAASATDFSVSLLGSRKAPIINGVLAILVQAFTLDIGRTDSMLRRFDGVA